MFRTRSCVVAITGALVSIVVGACGGGGAPSPSDGDAARRAARAAFDATCSMQSPGLGAHLSHSGTAVRGPISCLECHAPCAPAPAEKVAFGALAAADGAAPLWSDAAKTCAGVYCHGATGVTPTAPIAWTYVDPDRPRPPEEQCGTCHGYPPPPPHAASTSCGTCHSSSVNTDGTIDLAGGHHVDGVLDVSCNGCHEFPPQTGAHVAHAGPPVDGDPPLDYATLQDRYPGASPADAPAHYAFGCGTCHSLDPALHHDGKIDIVLAPSDGPANSLKARNAPGAAYDAGSGTCSGVYCHSTGQEYPGYAVTPGWKSGVKPGCAGCHANPPAYANGGPGAPDANGHVNFADDDWESGHFLAVPGVWHGGSKHGYQGAAPITCQSCHFDTVDPANTAPGGFYYLDTTGTYQLPGGDPLRIESGWTAQLDCTSCHTGEAGAPPQGSGRVLPLRHVNGTRDVVFDPRTALPALAWLPPAPSTPVKPYWTAESVPYFAWGPTAVLSGTTMSYDLTTARYDAPTKTCSGAACHLEDVPVWGKQNGFGGEEWPNCYLCHSEF